jgi:hypothetical protein
MTVLLITVTAFFAATLTSITLTGCSFALVEIKSSTESRIRIGLGLNSQRSYTYSALDLPNEIDQQKCLPYAQSKYDALISWNKSNSHSVLSVSVLGSGACALILLGFFEFSMTFKKSWCLHLVVLGLLLSFTIQFYIALCFIPRKEDVCGLTFMFEVLRIEFLSSTGTLSITCKRGASGIISEIAASAWGTALGIILFYDWEFCFAKQEQHPLEQPDIDDDTSIESGLSSLGEDTISVSSSFPITLPPSARSLWF